MLMNIRTIEVDIPEEEYDNLSDEKSEAISVRIEELLENAMDSIKTDFECVFGNDKDVTVTLNISEL